MSKKYMYLFGAALLALSGMGVTAQSAQAKGARHVRRTNVTRNYNRVFVNAPLSVSSNATSISGNATPGAHVTLQNNNKTVASVVANAKTGKYVLNVPKHFRAGTSFRVMAQKGYDHPFRDVVVKTPANQKAAVKANQKPARKSARKMTKRVAKPAKKVTRKTTKATRKNKARVSKATAKSAKAKSVKVTRKAPAKAAKLAQSPTGTWTANQSKRNSQRWTFSQSRGLNESLYRNGRYVKRLVTNAPYKVNALKPDFWEITYKPAKARKSSTFYMHLLTNDRFQLTNAKGRQASLKFVRA